MKILTKEDLPSNAVTVSHNQLVNHWYRCPYRWMLIYKRGLKLAETVGRRQNEGTIWHEIVGSFYQWFIDNQVPVGLLPMDALKELQNVALSKYNTSQGEMNNAYHMLGVFMLYHRWAAENETVAPLMAEAEVYAPTGLKTPEGNPIYLHAIIDLIAEDEFGDLGIIDHKTVEGKHWDTEDVFFDIQLMFYLCVLWLNGLDPKWVAINSINVKEYKTPKNQGLIKDSERFKRIYVPRDVFRQKGYYDEILLHIKNMYAADATYPKKLEKGCKYCAFNEHCTMETRGVAGADAVLEVWRANKATWEFGDVDDS